MTIVYFLIVLGFLIIIHELGHLIVAKMTGIYCETFSIGFGPRLIGFKKGETEYRVSLIPLGGYVKMLGEDPEDEAATSDPRSFSNKSKKVRAAVVAAGPAMNIIICLLLMPLVFMLGRTEPRFYTEAPVVDKVVAGTVAADAGILPGDIIVSVDGKKVNDWEGVIDRTILSPNGDVRLSLERSGETVEKTLAVESFPDMQGGYIGIEPTLFLGNRAIIGSVEKESPADLAGIREGDRVVGIDGKPVEYWITFLKTIGASEGRELDIRIEREGKVQEIKVAAKMDPASKRYILGVKQDVKQLADVETVFRRYGFFESIHKGWVETIRLTKMTFRVLGRLFTFQLSYKALGGPLQIAHAAAMAAETGLAGFVFFLAFVSLQLGVLNLLPIPVLDGGHLVFFGIEAVRRKPLSIKTRIVAQQVGLVLIIVLMALVTFNDIDRFFGIKRFLSRLF